MYLEIHYIHCSAKLYSCNTFSSKYILLIEQFFDDFSGSSASAIPDGAGGENVTAIHVLHLLLHRFYYNKVQYS